MKRPFWIPERTPIQLSLFPELDTTNPSASARSIPSSPETSLSEPPKRPKAYRQKVLRESASSRMQSWQSKLAGRNSSRIEKVPVGIHGARIGQWHPRAIYADAEIEMVFALRDAGWSISAIARKLEMPRSTVGAICSGKLRCATPEGWKMTVVKV
nr:MAG TPA: 54S ribosomal protein [Bacteriophage sp.]